MIIAASRPRRVGPGGSGCLRTLRRRNFCQVPHTSGLLGRAWIQWSSEQLLQMNEYLYEVEAVESKLLEARIRIYDDVRCASAIEDPSDGLADHLQCGRRRIHTDTRSIGDNSARLTSVRQR